MKNNKIMRTIIGLTLLVALLVPVTALATSPNYYYNFVFTDRVNHQEAYHEKGDTEQNCTTLATVMFPVPIFLG